jgi:hypothetical protein
MNNNRGMNPKEQFTTGDTCILVPSWDGYEDLWMPFFGCLFKYWPDCPYRVYLGSNKKAYDDPRVGRLSSDINSDYSASLAGFLKQIPHQWVIVWLEDLLLKARVNTKDLNHLIKWAQEQKAVHVRLWTGPGSLISLAAARHPVADLPGVGLVPKKARYRAGLTVGLWRKDTLLGLLRDGESAWDFEIAGSLRSDSISGPIYSVIPCGDDNSMLKVVNSVRKGLWSIDGVCFLQKEGLADVTKTRRVEWRWKYEYIMRFKLPLRKILYNALHR